MTNRNTLFCATGKTHDWRVARERGSRIRLQCKGCGYMDKWIKKETDPVEQARQVERGELPSGHVVIKATGDNSMLSRAQEEHETMDAYWDSQTVADLKGMCKKKGITGYSKMKRDDLINVLLLEGDN
jgi:Rho termination factor, N-terminal domain